MASFDLSGQTFGSLTVLRRNGGGSSKTWECRCVCGNIVVCRTGNLRQKSGTKCWCAGRLAKAASQTSHDLSLSAEYQRWTGMMTRCFNPKTKAFPRYGGRGITVSPEWRSFEAFLADIGPLPSRDHSIERIDNDGPYSPTNCRWATRAEQALNTSSNRMLDFNGEQKPLAEWARWAGLSPDALWARIEKLHWPVAKALTTPHRGWGPRSAKMAPVKITAE